MRRAAIVAVLVLAIDIGTSSTRTALFNESGARILATSASESYPLVTDAAGRAEIAPGRLLAAVRGCVGRTLVAARTLKSLRGRPIAAVGTSCFWHSLIGVDADGEAVTPIITWADSRCRVDAERLRRRHDEHAIHARTGCMLRASFWPAKLAWLERVHRGTFRQAERWMSPAEWLYLHICGGLRCAHGMATGTGLYDPAAMTWDGDAVARAHLRPAQLPPISDEPLMLGAAARRSWPELAQARWFPAIGDGAANNLGAGATRPGWAAINFGTSAAVRIMRDKPFPGDRGPRAPYGLFCYRVDSERFLVGGAISNAGSLRAWCMEHLRLPDDATIERQLARRAGPAHGLRVLPFWLAERAPSWRDDLAGAIVGITQSTSALDLLQAITEASFHRLATIVDALPGSGARLRFVVGGGLQRSPAGLQRLADVLGRDLLASHEPELSLRGAAVFALEKLGAPPERGAASGEPVRARRTQAHAYARERARLLELEGELHPLPSGAGSPPTAKRRAVRRGRTTRNARTQP